MGSPVPRILIVGAGFGGLAAALRLAGKPVDVTLVDRRNHHLFQPLLYQVATAALSPADIAAPIRSTFAGYANVRVLLDELTSVDPARREARMARSGPLEYDWLVLATGAGHSYFGHPEWARHAPGLKTIEDAINIRRRILLALEFAETETDARRRAEYLTFVVIGAGPTGVEMAGAIAELARRTVSRDFRSITPACSRVILVEAGPRILSSFPVELSRRAERSLLDLGVEVRTGVPVAEVSANQLVVGEDSVSARTIIWAAGVKASSAAEWLGADRDAQGRIRVESDLTVPGMERVFAIGDTAVVAGENGRNLPAIAPVAKQQGRYVADRILGRGSGDFRYRDFGNLATIGRKSAVIDWGRWQVGGFVAWLVWSVAHVVFLIDFRSRLSVGTSWLWSYLTYQRSARLITGRISDACSND